MCGQAEVGGQGIMPCPEAARVERDFSVVMQQNNRLRKAVALLNAMVLSGESHSETSRQVVREALN